MPSVERVGNDILYRIAAGGSVIYTDETGAELFRVTSVGDAVKVAGQSLNPAALGGLTATAAELNTLVGITATAAELNRLVGVTAPPVQTVERTFVETTGDGVYTATVAIPAGATVLDVIFRNTALWTSSTSASLVVGDDDDPDGYIAATDVKAAPLADTFGAAAGISSRLSLGATAGAYKGGGGKFCAVAKTITATITKVGTGTAGRSRLLVTYALPSTAAATKA